MKYPSLFLVIFFVLKYTLADINVAIQDFFWNNVRMLYFFKHPICIFIFRVRFLLAMYSLVFFVFFFLIHYDKLCLLIGMLKQFKFIMIMNMVRFESIFLLFVFYFSLLFCTLFLSILLFFWITWEMFYDSILCPLLAHAMGWILSLPNLYVEAPSPNVTVFGDKAFMEVIRVRWGPNSGSLIQ